MSAAIRKKSSYTVAEISRKLIVCDRRSDSGGPRRRRLRLRTGIDWQGVCVDFFWKLTGAFRSLVWSVGELGGPVR